MQEDHNQEQPPQADDKGSFSILRGIYRTVASFPKILRGLANDAEEGRKKRLEGGFFARNVVAPMLDMSAFLLKATAKGIDDLTDVVRSPAFNFLMLVVSCIFMFTTPYGMFIGGIAAGVSMSVALGTAGYKVYKLYTLTEKREQHQQLKCLLDKYEELVKEIGDDPVKLEALRKIIDPEKKYEYQKVKTYKSVARGFIAALPENLITILCSMLCISPFSLASSIIGTFSNASMQVASTMEYQEQKAVLFNDSRYMKACAKIDGKTYVQNYNERANELNAFIGDNNMNVEKLETISDKTMKDKGKLFAQCLGRTVKASVSAEHTETIFHPLRDKAVNVEKQAATSEKNESLGTKYVEVEIKKDYREKIQQEKQSPKLQTREKK